MLEEGVESTSNQLYLGGKLVGKPWRLVLVKGQEQESLEDSRLNLN